MLREILAEEKHWWLFYLATILFFMLVVEVGYRFGRRRRNKADPEQKSQTGTVLASLLALLGFLLAISFGIAADRFGERKALVLEEANAVSTAFLRADFLDAPQRMAVQRLLREYAQMRVEYVRRGDLGEVEEGLARSEEAHRELWALARAAAGERPRSVPVGLFVDSLNEVIDLHEERVTVGLRHRIPPSLLWTLYLVAFLSMGTMGIHFGLSGTRNGTTTVALVVAFAAVLLLIVDLDQPTQRLFDVSQEPLADTVQIMDDALEYEPPRGGGPAE
ncbi:MAG: hypothetical protein ACLFVJ_17665 [Persicimonas sp.]